VHGQDFFVMVSRRWPWQGPKEYAVHYARRDTCHRREVGNWAAPATGWLLESIKRVAGEGEETEEIKIKRPGAVRPEEDKET